MGEEMKKLYLGAVVLAAALLVAVNAPGVYALGGGISGITGVTGATNPVPGVPFPTIGGLTPGQALAYGYWSGVRPSGYGQNYYGGNNSYTSPYYYWDGNYGYYNGPDKTGTAMQSCVWNGYQWQCYNTRR
jgi:hypothetical protein